ncbi:hypothetical protein [Staphylococcus xylosus]|uniref:hypothetical protein n=1 Tax=Staphylococcus xylosus TaxID=1288 RepID=UPI001AACFDA7|nr:hypothetical protein [Staphylococcus xylosus]MBO3075408.1 hypothetical protein [Staphylococcus xylosus]MEB7765781.1 hypothetical protein [Staphylococcus xylosus]
MKDKKFIIMISSILGVMLLLFMVFEVAAIFNTNLTESSNRSLEISIALFAMFATFGGAYLGAKFAGNNALRLQERKMIRDYLIQNYKMLSLMDRKGFKDIKSELKKYNNKLLNDEKQPYGIFNEILKNLDAIVKLRDELQFTDGYTEAKFEIAICNINDIKIKNSIKELIQVDMDGGDDRGKKQMTDKLNNEKLEIYELVEKVGESLKDVPLIDINNTDLRL